MAKGNILKEAIADAKAVREVALANAKAALEEAFTPKIQNMLSAKLQEDLDEDIYMDEDDERELDLGEMEEDGDEGSMDEEIDLEEILNELELEDGDTAEEDEDLDEAVGKPNHRAEYVRDVMHKAEDINAGLAEDKEFDLNSLLKEINDLEDEEITEEKEEEEVTEAKKDKKEEKVTETRARSKRQVAESFGCKQKDKKITYISRKLQESKKALSKVTSELNEVNLLNSKLLYVNRIFKANNLDDSQKLRVVETLDKADSTKEAKLIYETIKDTFKVASTKKVSKKTETKTIKENFRGMASKAAGMSRTKKVAPKKAVISESENMVNRFQKLANIKINE